MKTNQTLTRPMGNFEVFQRTQDGFFNATALLKQWNSQSKSERKMDNYFNVKGTNEFVDTIMKRENLHTPKMVYLKSRASRGINSGTWMHPMLFIDFAMWINPEFKYDVLKFVYDQLIQYRNEAGNAYKDMCAAIASVSKNDEIAKNISKIAKAVNIVVYGRHIKEARNKMAEENSMKELVSLQSNVAQLINIGILNKFEDIREYLLKLWRLKNQPKELMA